MSLLARLLGKKPEDELRSALGDYRLPSFPAVVVKARHKIRDEDATNADIADCIIQDPGLSCRVLATVNSASFGVRRRVESVAHATALLGRAQVEAMLLSHGVGSALPKPTGGTYCARRFWQAAARRATIARALAERLHPAVAAQCFTGALLQDLAVPILAQVHGRRYEEALQRARVGENLHAVERELFGWDHPEIGSWIGDAWEFPDGITVSIAAHHGGNTALGDPPAAIAAVALLSEDPRGEDVDRLVEHVHECHGIAADDVVALVCAANDDSDALAQLFC